CARDSTPLWHSASYYFDYW
nr:immunoglobulin heavy chain junction region [Macaca mulatta]MOV36775.1 immunoglobulin heavy chain junction region [Macaca mulatta]